MIHTKSLVQRLAYGPLLVVGLVLGWSGEAEAEAKYTVNAKFTQNEDGSIAYHVVLKLKDGPIDEDTSVDLGSSLASFVPETYRIEAPTFLIPAGETETMGTILLIPIVELDGIAATPRSIREGAGETTFTLTVSLKEAFEAPATVSLAIVRPARGRTAQPDEDFTTTLPETITIPAGEIAATAEFTILPQDNQTADGDKFIGVQATSLSGSQVQIDIEFVDNEFARPAVSSDDGSASPDSDEEDGQAEDSEDTFAFASTVDDQAYTEGTEITALVLPEATGGEGELTYSVSTLPAGLSFDAATRTISGTPSAATNGAVTIVYTVIDEEESTAALTFTITVSEKPDFGNLFDLFGAGKVVPTAPHGLAEIREFIVGQRVEGIVLPAASGGTAPLTYSLSPALPAGLTFDAVTRTIAGTPRAAAETAYTYTVTDANGATAALSLQTRPTDSP